MAGTEGVPGQTGLTEVTWEVSLSRKKGNKEINKRPFTAKKKSEERKGNSRDHQQRAVTRQNDFGGYLERKKSMRGWQL